MKCAVIIPVGPGNELYALDAEESVALARATLKGPFAEIICIKVDDAMGRLGSAKAHNHGTQLAHEAGANWIFFLDARDMLCPRAFANIAADLCRYDAIWGAIHELAQNEEGGVERPGQLLEISRLDQLLANDPQNTLQTGHFVKTAAALATPFDPALVAGGDFDYYLRMWSQFNCVKLPLPFCYNRPSSRPAGEFEARRRAAIERIICAKCAAVDFQAEFDYRGQSFRFFVNNPFDLIHRSFLKGRFFESAELEFVETWVGTQAAILEVGAYVGNHVVYYACFMQPRSIMVIEPNPESIALLRRNLEANAVMNADLSSLGLGASDAKATYDIVSDSTDNGGAARLVRVAGGGIEAVPLDDLVDGEVDFIKIDVEGMELEVLAGAAGIIAASQPKIMIEVVRARIPGFEAWMAVHRYRVKRRFDNVYATNFMVEPAGG